IKANQNKLKNLSSYPSPHSLPLSHPLCPSRLSLSPTKLVPLSLTHKLTVNILLRSQLTHHQNRNHDARLRRIQCRGSLLDAESAYNAYNCERKMNNQLPGSVRLEARKVDIETFV
ncbi:hypothetical protein CUMW_251050, partial [Citrus unshiu]